MSWPYLYHEKWKALGYMQAWSLGAKELQLQAWGSSAAKMYSVGLDLAGIDNRVVVKLPITDAGVEAAALLKKQGVLVTLTGCILGRKKKHRRRMTVQCPVLAHSADLGVHYGALLMTCGWHDAEICHTGVYTAHQAFTAMAAGADYAAPYLGRMNDAGRNVGSAPMLICRHLAYFLSQAIMRV